MARDRKAPGTEGWVRDGGQYLQKGRRGSPVPWTGWQAWRNREGEGLQSCLLTRPHGKEMVTEETLVGYGQGSQDPVTGGPCLLQDKLLACEGHWHRTVQRPPLNQYPLCFSSHRWICSELWKIKVACCKHSQLKLNKETLCLLIWVLSLRDDQKIDMTGGSGVQGALVLGPVDGFESQPGTC